MHNPNERISAEDLLKSPLMSPPQLNIDNFFQLADYLISSGKKMSTYQEYYRLMQTCLMQTTSEGKILKWLANYDNDLCNRQRPQVYSKFPSICETFIKRCHEIGAQYFQVKFNFRVDHF